MREAPLDFCCYVRQNTDPKVAFRTSNETQRGRVHTHNGRAALFDRKRNGGTPSYGRRESKAAQGDCFAFVASRNRFSSPQTPRQKCNVTKVVVVSSHSATVPPFHHQLANAEFGCEIWFPCSAPGAAVEPKTEEFRSLARADVPALHQAPKYCGYFSFCS